MQSYRNRNNKLNNAEFKIPAYVNFYILRKHQRPGTRYWVKVTPLVKETSWNPEIAEESVDIQDVRARLGGWPIVEAAVSRLTNDNSQSMIIEHTT